MTAALRVVALALGCASLAACGKKAPPLPPLVRLPVPPADFSALRRGPVVNVQFGVPTANTDDSTPADVGALESPESRDGCQSMWTTAIKYQNHSKAGKIAALEATTVSQP